MSGEILNAGNIASYNLYPLREIFVKLKKTSSQCCYIFGPSGSMTVENGMPLKTVLPGMRDVALFIIANEQTQ